MSCILQRCLLIHQTTVNEFTRTDHLSADRVNAIAALLGQFANECSIANPFLQYPLATSRGDRRHRVDCVNGYCRPDD